MYPLSFNRLFVRCIVIQFIIIIMFIRHLLNVQIFQDVLNLLTKRFKLYVKYSEYKLKVFLTRLRNYFQ